jgi:hypothetical protein
MNKILLSTVADDYLLELEDFSAYCFANFPDYVWETSDGFQYCNENEADYLVHEYLEWMMIVEEYY